MREDPPELVVSGIDFGHNVGADVLGSGTVGAAVTASRSGVPAIAVSVEVDPEERGRATPFPSTVAAFDAAAAFVVELIRQLAESDADGLLPPRTALNVNYPAVGSEQPAGVRFTTIASVRGFRTVFSVGGPTGPARVEMTPGRPELAEPGSDAALLAQDFVSISVLDGNLDAGSGSWSSLLGRLVIER
jgi:5'-nucleotidase